MKPLSCAPTVVTIASATPAVNTSRLVTTLVILAPPEGSEHHTATRSRTWYNPVHESRSDAPTDRRDRGRGAGCRVDERCADPLRDSNRRADRSVHRQAARHRDDRHRKRARRSNVDGALPRVLKPIRRRGTDRHHVDMDEEQG